MADLFRNFLDFRPPHTSYKLHVVLPSKHLSSTHVYSPSSRILRINRTFHLKLISRPSAPTPSSIDVVSTHEHSDGSLVFQFGEPGEAASSVHMEEPNVEKEIERGGINDDLVVNVLNGDKGGCVKDSSLAEVTDESNSIVVDSKNISIGEKENDLDEKLMKGATEFEFPTTASNVDLKDSSTQSIDMEDTGDRQEYLNDEQENSSMKSVSPDFDVISTCEHSDGSLIFRFGDLSESASNAQHEESKVEKDIEEEGTEEDNMVTDLNGDDDGGVRDSSLAEVTNESTSMDFDGKNLSISEKKNDLGNDIENDGKDEDCFNEKKDSSSLMSVPMLANSAKIENSIAAVETPENNIVDVTMLQTISLSPDTLTESEKDASQDSIDTVVSTELFADSKIGDDINNILTAAPGMKAVLRLSIDAEAQTSLERNELHNEIAEDESESGIIQLMPMSPKLETGQTNDEESVSVDGEEYRDTDKAESLKLLADIPQKSILVSESTEDDDDVNGNIVESSGNQVMEMEPTEVSIKSQEIQMTDFVLSSGAALLPHPSKVLTGGEDAYFVTGQTWLGVADGVGQWSFEGTNPGVYAQELIKNCEKLALDCNSDSICNPTELLKLSIGETQSPGSSTVLLAQLVGQVLQVANIGDSGFIILRHGSVYKRSSPMLHVFHFPLQIERGDDPSNLAEFYRIDLEEEDVIILASDGLLDNLYDQEITSEVSKYLAADCKPKEIAEALAAKAQEVGKSATARSPFADNAQAAGYAGYTGGKLDDVTVIVSVVQRQSCSQTL
ncbi:uncharacterized protein LOC142518005 isoform X2 [Primulina tabacum]|uniref:uncharacterized protein LOC142518005 isoform X2 n=1 Tax=Primulina tabacum TaxID=48773 RepID=UPI003F591BA5